MFWRLVLYILVCLSNGVGTGPLFRRYQVSGAKANASYTQCKQRLSQSTAQPHPTAAEQIAWKILPDPHPTKYSGTAILRISTPCIHEVCIDHICRTRCKLALSSLNVRYHTEIMWWQRILQSLRAISSWQRYLNSTWWHIPVNMRPLLMQALIQLIANSMSPVMYTGICFEMRTSNSNPNVETVYAQWHSTV